MLCLQNKTFPFRGKQATAGRSRGIGFCYAYNQGKSTLVPLHTFAKIVKQTTQNLDVKITQSPTLTLKLPTPVKPEKINEECQGYDE